MENQTLTHFEAPKRRQRDLLPFHAILLFQSHPRNSFCDIENLLPALKDTKVTALPETTLTTAQSHKHNT